MDQDYKNPDIEVALNEIEIHADGYHDAKNYDDINIWDVNSLDRLGETLRRSDIEYDPNYCAIVIDSVNNKMNISSLVALVGNDAPKDPGEVFRRGTRLVHVGSGARPDEPSNDVDMNAGQSADATSVLNKVWADNDMESYYRQWDRNALRDGDGYVMVWPETEESALDVDDEVIDRTPDPTTVNITYIDPRNGRMFYDPRNPRRKRFFAQTWFEDRKDLNGEAYTRLNLIYPDRIEKWISTTSRHNRKVSEFEPYYGDPESDTFSDEWPLPNPYGQIPVFHLRTAHEYGQPEHRNAFAPQDAISKLTAMLMVTVEFQAFPQRYALMEADKFLQQTQQHDPMSEVYAGSSDSEAVEININSLQNGDYSNETGSEFESNPGGMLVLKNFSEVGQFETVDPEAYLKPYQEFVRAISSTTATPLYKFQTGGQIPSGEALRIVDRPLNDKVRNRCRMFGNAYEQMLEFALMVLGYTARVNITWETPEDNDSVDVWNLVEKKIKLGVPPHKAYMDAGIPEREAREWEASYLKAKAEFQNRFELGREEQRPEGDEK